jgi:hypothetical protein
MGLISQKKKSCKNTRLNHLDFGQFQATSSPYKGFLALPTFWFAKTHMHQNNSNLVIAMESLKQKIKHLLNCSTILKRKPPIQMVTTHNPTRKP